MISISDLLNLSKNIIALQDRLKRVKLRIKNHLVDDLDYFTFPKKIMLSNLLNKTDEEIINERRKYNSNKRIMIKQILKFSKKI